MKQGKQTCRILKEIRQQIAEANDIEFITSECQYQGDCLGTCPKCEAEVHYLEQQLLSRQKSGLGIKIVGVSLGLSAALVSSPLYGQEIAKDSLNKSLPQTEVVCKDSKVPVSQEEEALFGMVEAQPQFPGGHKALMEYLANNIKYPKNKPRLSGRVIVQFTITKKGKIIDAKVARGIHPDYDKEALRIIKKMPRWEPGTQMGKPVNVRFTVPVIFQTKQ